MVLAHLVLIYCTVDGILALGPGEATTYVTVSLRQGQELRGLQKTSAAGVVFDAFYGVPYAQPPTGTRRFRPSEPALEWTGVRDALTISAICPQPNAEQLMSEDCLYLNVFTPDVNASLPVLVWVHGGGYVTGSAFNDGDGATLAPHGIVAVTINYRLGAFGFLSTGDDVMPGNYGMLDQILALKWVQEYIRAFGGDPDQVTLAGESAGAHSVSLQTISPLTKGLFHRAVLESGSALALSAVEVPGRVENVTVSTLKTAARVGCNLTKSSEILQCLQKVGVNELLNASRDAVILVRIETTFGFLPDFPINLIKTGQYHKIDTLRGVNSGENAGSIHDPDNHGVTKQQFVDVIKSRIIDLVNLEEILDLLVPAYMGNETDPIALRTILVHAVADISYGAGELVEVYTFASDVESTTTHFLYEFDYRISGTTSPVWQGVGHAAERRFVFYPDSRYNYTTPTDRAVGEAVQAMWVNFVKYGDPTPSDITHASTTGSGLVSWRPFTKNSPNLFKIDANCTLVNYPRLFVVPLYENILEIVKQGPTKRL